LVLAVLAQQTPRLKEPMVLIQSYPQQLLAVAVAVVPMLLEALRQQT
jgi:hypothetical protein